MFNTKVNFKKNCDFGALSFYETEINDLKYIVSCTKTTSTKALRVQFDLAKEGQGVTGTGNAFLILGAISNLIFDLMKEHKITNVSFSSKLKQSSRVNVYDKIVKRLNNQGLIQKIEIEDDEDVREYFINFNPNLILKNNKTRKPRFK